MKLTLRQIHAFQRRIFDWWKGNKRDLPWRHTRDPYRILVSEVMLQQTQVPRVIAKYREFIKRYPTIKDLAKASMADVLKTWKGLGYNRRALYLHQSAKAVVKTYRENFPDRETELVKLPGLGIYTARAILVFAFMQDIACVDTNVRQILTHYFFHDVPQKPAVIQSIADQLVPRGKSWEWHQALMDYGALELTRLRRPDNRRRTIIPFSRSNRFLRGRIVDRLREGAMRESDLIALCARSYDRPVALVRSVLDGLERDGLIFRSKRGSIALPT